MGVCLSIYPTIHHLSIFLSSIIYMLPIYYLSIYHIFVYLTLYHLSISPPLSRQNQPGPKIRLRKEEIPGLPYTEKGRRETILGAPVCLLHLQPQPKPHTAQSSIPRDSHNHRDNARLQRQLPADHGGLPRISVRWSR